ncbi:MAG: TM0996/MTH895 family glutaredoxin-like protein [Bryobacteraceae bacterium]|nr:TM0996/MTH895 family glutaredoxin-like protein [Bryobacteraceae bacterium]
MKIEIFGTGCARCNQLTENARVAVERLGLADCDFVKVNDFNEIAKRGVLLTPALLIDGKVKVIGKAASPDEVERYLKEAGAAGRAK